jgi:hypothetical protein
MQRFIEDDAQPSRPAMLVYILILKSKTDLKIGGVACNKLAA